MNEREVPQTLFNDLVADLPDHHKAEFFQNLHEAGISPNDIELARLLRILQLYKAYYESIPAAVQSAAAEVERLSNDARHSSENCARLTDQFVQQAERFRQDLAEIHDRVEEATHESAENLTSRMADLLSVSLEQKVFQPLESRLADLAVSNHAFDDAIERSYRASAALRQNVKLARRLHFGAYALGAFLIACSLTLAFWLSLDYWYAGRMEQERAALVQQMEKNRAVLLKLAESHRTLELIQDPERPRRKLLVMKDASGRSEERRVGKECRSRWWPHH